MVSISIKRDLLMPVRSGCSALVKNKNETRTHYPSRKNCFFLGLHGIYSISETNQYQLIWRTFHSVRSSALWWGVRHALIVAGTPLMATVLAYLWNNNSGRRDQYSTTDGHLVFGRYRSFGYWAVLLFLQYFMTIINYRQVTSGGHRTGSA